MADLSRVNDKLATIEQKVSDLVAFKQSIEQGDGGHDQAAVDELETRLDAILARIP